MVSRSAVLLIAGSLLFAGSSSAQSQTVGKPPAGTPAGDALWDLFFHGVAGSSLEPDALLLIFSAHLATFPLATSAGGFSWMFDPTLGVQTRRSRSYGPMFAERPLTNGRRRFNLAVTFQHTTFESIGGQPLNGLVSGSRNFRLTTDLHLTTDNTIVTASYGITDHIDVGVVVPFGRTAVQGLSTEFLQSSTGVILQDRAYTANASSSGLADVVLRGKAGLSFGRRFDVGGAVDLRLPTGGDPVRSLAVGFPYDDCVGNHCIRQIAGNKLLGVGKAQTKVLLLGAVKAGNVSPHFNVGYTFAGSGADYQPAPSPGSVDINRSEPSDEINYTFGADISVSNSLTIAGDVIGRTLRDTVRLEYGTRLSGNPPAAITGFAIRPGNVRLLLGVVDVKVKVGGLWLITGSLLFPLNDEGVKPGITPVIGFERAF